MKIKSKKVKILISVLAVVVALTVAAIAVLPALSQKELKNRSFVAKKQTGEVFFEGFDTAVSGSDGESLLINGKTGAIALVSSDGNVVFNSNSFDAAEQLLANALSLRLRDGDGNSYTMNSTDNSVAFGTFKVVKQGKTHTDMVFELFPDSDAAGKGVGKTDIFASVTLELTFENNSFKASVDTSSVKLPENFYIEKLSLLPGLFSVSEATGEEFYTVPDGSGALIDLSAVSEEPLVLDLGMYGSDVAFYEYSQGAVLPFFAMTKAGCVVNTIISEGDALSELTCKRFADGGGYLYNTFTVTACGMVDGKLRVGEPYMGEVSQTYSVKEVEDNGYNYIAAQVRDDLISRGYLSDEISGKFVDFPFFVNVLGSADGKTSSTTFEDAAEITALLKSRGVRNIALRFSGAGKKGLATVGADSDTFDSDLGGKGGYNEMAESVTGQGNTTWLDVNICTAKSRNKDNTVKVYDTQSKFAGFSSQSASLSSYDSITDNISECYTHITELESADVCLNDASMLLYTDLEGGYNRQQMLDNMRENIGALSAKGSLMLSYPAVYMLNEADAVFSVPDTASCDGEKGVTSVPILQIVLHGSVVYGSSYMNLTNLSAEDALLRVFEYGSAPSFLFTHSTGSNLNYNMYTSQTAQLYSQAKKLLPVMDMKITSHELVVSGVYKITYDYSKVIYVNYNPSVVDVNGIMISAKDFVII